MSHTHRHVNKTSKQQKQQYKAKKMDSFNLSIIVWLTRVPKHGVCTHKCSTELCYEINQFFFLVKFRLNQFRKVTFQSDPNKVSIKWMTMSFFSASDLVASVRSSRKIEEDMHDIKITIFRGNVFLLLMSALRTYESFWTRRFFTHIEKHVESSFATQIKRRTISVDWVSKTECGKFPSVV